MKRLKYIILLLVLMLPICQIHGQTVHSTRNQAMGGALHTTAGDQNALFLNPAGLCLFDYHGGIANYTTMYSGFSHDGLGQGSIGYVHHLGRMWHLGLTADILYSDIFRRNIIKLPIALSFKKLSLSLRPFIVITGYREENFLYGEDDNPDDPMFADGFGATGFGFDVGGIYKIDGRTSIGIYAGNILEPDLALSSLESRMPIDLRLGAKRNFDHELIAIDLHWDTDNINENPVNAGLGLESRRFSDNFPLRAGANFEQLSFGVGFEKLDFHMMKIDYAFIYPLSRVGQEIPGSHKFSLSFGLRPRPKPDIIAVEKDSILPPPEEPYVNLTVTPDELYLDEITQVYEEEPLVPVVFFDAGSADVDKRFDPMIHVIGERIAKNPDVTLKLFGYYDPRSEDNEGFLNIQRAENLRKRFIELVPDAASGIEVVKTGFQPEAERAGLGREAPTERQQEMINQENRRVEFQLDIDSEKYSPHFVRESDKKLIADSYIPILKDNPDIDLIIEGGGSDDRFRKAFSFEDELFDIIPEEYRERIFVSLSKSGENRVRLNAQGIIFRPRQVRSTVEHSDIKNPAKIEIEHNIAFSEHAIDIVTLEKEPVRRVASGKGLPPEKLYWDWTDERGELVDIRQKYLSRLTGYDKSGRFFEVFSKDTLRIHITEKMRLKSRLLIVQFVYDRDQAQSIYLEDRLEYISRNLIELIHSDKESLLVTIEGHTDTLGTTRRNEELSLERATEEYENIRQYLRQLLEIDSDELDRRLSENDSQVNYKGFGPHRPYSISYVDGEKIDVKLLGDNNLPEGRTINRRVVIELYLER